MDPDHLLEFRDIVFAGHLGHGDIFLVELQIQFVFLIQHIGHTAGHARGEVLAGGAQHRHAAAGHVFAAVVSHALHHGTGAGIPHTEALSGDAADIGLSAGGSVQGHVSDNDVLTGIDGRFLRRPYDEAPAGQALAEIVVAVAGEADGHPLRKEGSEGLPSAPFRFHVHRIRRQGSAFFRDLRTQDGAEGAVHTGYVHLHGLGFLVFQRPGKRRHQHLHVRGLLQLEVIHGIRGEVHGTVVSVSQDVVQAHRVHEALRQVLPPLQQGLASHQFLHGAHSQAGHDASEFLGDEEHEVHDVFRSAPEPAAQVRVLGGHPHGAGIQVAGAHHDAAHGHQRSRGETEFLRAQDRGDGHVPSGEELAVGLQDDPFPQSVLDEGAVSFAQSQFPGQSRIMDGASGSGAGASVVSGDQHHLGTGLGHAGGDGSDAGFRHQLHGDACIPVGILQIVNELCQILDGIDVMMRRRADEADAGGGISRLGDPGIDLLSRQVSPFSGLGSLGHLDLDLPGGAQILAGDAEAARGHLLDGTVSLRAQPFRHLAPFSGVGLAPQPVHGNGQTLVGLLGDGAVGHGAGLEAFDDALRRFHFLQRDPPVFRIIKVQQSPQGLGCPLLVDAVGIGEEFLEIVFPHRFLQRHDGTGIVQMLFTALSGAHLMESHTVQRGIHLQIQRIKGMVVVILHRLPHLLQPDTAHLADGMGKVLVDDILTDPHRLEDLCRLIGLDGGHAHLGGDLHDAPEDGVVVVVDGGMGILVQKAQFHAFLNALVGKVRADGPGTVAQRTGPAPREWPHGSHPRPGRKG